MPLLSLIHFALLLRAADSNSLFVLPTFALPSIFSSMPFLFCVLRSSQSPRSSPSSICFSTCSLQLLALSCFIAAQISFASFALESWFSFVARDSTAIVSHGFFAAASAAISDVPPSSNSNSNSPFPPMSIFTTNPRIASLMLTLRLCPREQKKTSSAPSSVTAQKCTGVNTILREVHGRTETKLVHHVEKLHQPIRPQTQAEAKAHFIALY